MKTCRYEVAREVFQQFPGYTLGVVSAHGINNNESDSELMRLLREAESSIQARLSIKGLAEYAPIRAWREAYRSFGSKPGKYRSSVESMVRRVLRERHVPSINALVDIANAKSLQHLVPVGVHALDELGHDIAVRPATGGEEFVPFDSEEVEHPLPGEVILAEGDRVLTRRWTWRQSRRTRISPTTRAVFFNIDALPPVRMLTIEKVSREIASLVESSCGGDVRVNILTEEAPRMKLTW
jgi:DNA/RNA-binding domain of Phe-tRNA-synthetase-like protein